MDPSVQPPMAMLTFRLGLRLLRPMARAYPPADTKCRERGRCFQWRNLDRDSFFKFLFDNENKAENTVNANSNELG